MKQKRTNTGGRRFLALALALVLTIGMLPGEAIAAFVPDVRALAATPGTDRTLDYAGGGKVVPVPAKIDQTIDLTGLIAPLVLGEAKTYSLSGGTTYPITVAADCTIILNRVIVTSITAPLTITRASVTLLVVDGTVNSFTCTYDNSDYRTDDSSTAGIYVDASSTLTIQGAGKDGTGMLFANGGSYGAGIGSSATMLPKGGNGVNGVIGVGAKGSLGGVSVAYSENEDGTGSAIKKTIDSSTGNGGKGGNGMLDDRQGWTDGEPGTNGGGNGGQGGDNRGSSGGGGGAYGGGNGGIGADSVYAPKKDAMAGSGGGGGAGYPGRDAGTINIVSGFITGSGGMGAPGIGGGPGQNGGNGGNAGNHVSAAWARYARAGKGGAGGAGGNVTLSIAGGSVTANAGNGNAVAIGGGTGGAGGLGGIGSSQPGTTEGSNGDGGDGGAGGAGGKATISVQGGRLDITGNTGLYAIGTIGGKGGKGGAVGSGAAGSTGALAGAPGAGGSALSDVRIVGGQFATAKVTSILNANNNTGNGTPGVAVHPVTIEVRDMAGATTKNAIMRYAVNAGTANAYTYTALTEENGRMTVWLPEGNHKLNADDILSYGSGNIPKDQSATVQVSSKAPVKETVQIVYIGADGSLTASPSYSGTDRIYDSRVTLSIAAGSDLGDKTTDHGTAAPAKGKREIVGMRWFRVDPDMHTQYQQAAAVGGTDLLPGSGYTNIPAYNDPGINADGGFNSAYPKVEQYVKNNFQAMWESFLSKETVSTPGEEDPDKPGTPLPPTTSTKYVIKKDLKDRGSSFATEQADDTAATKQSGAYQNLQSDASRAQELAYLVENHPVETTAETKDKTAERSWSLNFNRNGYYWVQVVYKDVSGKEFNQVWGVEVDCLYDSFQTYVRGAVVTSQSGKRVTDSYLYGGANEYVPNTAMSKNYGLPLQTQYDRKDGLTAPNFSNSLLSVLEHPHLGFDTLRLPTDYQDSYYGTRGLSDYYSVVLGSDLNAGTGTTVGNKPVLVTTTGKKQSFYTSENTSGGPSNGVDAAQTATQSILMNGRFLGSIASWRDTVGSGNAASSKNPNGNFTLYYERLTGRWNTWQANLVLLDSGAPVADVNRKVFTTLYAPLDTAYWNKTITAANKANAKPLVSDFQKNGGMFTPPSVENRVAVGYYVGTRNEFSELFAGGGKGDVWYTPVADWRTVNFKGLTNESGQELFIVYSSRDKQVRVRHAYVDNDTNVATMFFESRDVPVTEGYYLTQNGEKDGPAITDQGMALPGYVAVGYEVTAAEDKSQNTGGLKAFKTTEAYAKLSATDSQMGLVEAPKLAYGQIASGTTNPTTVTFYYKKAIGMTENGQPVGIPIDDGARVRTTWTGIGTDGLKKELQMTDSFIRLEREHTAANDGAEGLDQHKITQSDADWIFALSETNTATHKVKTIDVTALVEINFEYDIDKDRNGVADKNQLMIEKYRVDGDATDTAIIPDTASHLLQNESYIKTPPALVESNGKSYAIKGYKLGTGDLVLADKITIDQVSEDVAKQGGTITFYYFTKSSINVQWIAKSDLGNEILAGTEVVNGYSGQDITAQVTALLDITPPLDTTNLSRTLMKLDGKDYTRDTPIVLGATAQTLKLLYTENSQKATVRVTLQNKSDGADLAPLVSGFPTSYQVVISQGITVTAPSIAGYTLSDGEALRKTLTKEQINGGETSIAFSYVPVLGSMYVKHIVEGRAQSAGATGTTLFNYAETVKKGTGAMLSYTAPVIPGYEAENPVQKLADNAEGTITFNYVQNAATVTVHTVKADDASEIGTPTTLTGYREGDSVTVKAPALKGELLQTVTVATGDNAVTFEYDPVSAVTFTLKEAVTDHIIRVVNAEAKTYIIGADVTTPELDLTASHYDYSSQHSDRDFVANGNTVTISDLTTTKDYIIGYTKQAREIHVVAKSKADGAVLKTDTVSGRVGESYTAHAPSIAGYALAGFSSKTIAVTAGTDALEVVFEYEKLSMGTITVTYMSSGKEIVKYTAQSGVGEKFVATAPAELQESKYQRADTSPAEKEIIVQNTNEVSFEYNKNFYSVQTYTLTSDAGATKVKAESYEATKNKDLVISAPQISGYELNGIMIAGVGDAQTLPPNYVGSKLTLSGLTADTEVIYCYGRTEDNLDKYQVGITVNDVYGKYALGSVVKSVKKGTTAVLFQAPNAKAYPGYTLAAYVLDKNGEVAITNPDAFTGVSLIPSDAHTIKFIFKRGDNSAAVPGMDAAVNTKDDVVITAGTANTAPVVNETTGVVTVPEGGKILLPDGNSIAPPIGTTVAPDGTISLPGGGGTITPGGDAELIGYVQVSYVANGGSGVMATQIVKENTPTTVLANAFTRTNYVFETWSEQETGKGTSYAPGKTISVAGTDISLYAQWKEAAYPNTATVVFNKNDTPNSTVISTQTLGGYAATTFTDQLKANAFAIDGWAFWRWNTKADGTGVSYADSAAVTLKKSETLTLFAQWYKLGTDGSIALCGADMTPGTPDDVTVLGSAGTAPTLNADGTIKIPAGGSVLVPPDMSTTLPNGGMLLQDGTIRLDDGTAIKPGETPIGYYKLTYHANYGTAESSSQYVKTGDNATAMQGFFPRAGYIFASWNTQADGQGTMVLPGTTISNTTVELYAQWFPLGADGSITVGQITVRPATDNPNLKPGIHKTNGNVTIPAGGTLLIGGEVIIPPAGSAVKPDGTILFADSVVFTPGTALPTDYYTVTYHANSGKGPVYKQYVKANVKFTLAQNIFTNSGNTFKGWSDKEEGAEVLVPGGDYTTSGNVTFFAQWKASDTFNATVIFHSNTGLDSDPSHEHEHTQTQNFTSKDSAVVGGRLNTKVFYHLEGETFAWTFYQWNTKADGTGTTYPDGGTVGLESGTTLDLYAVWYKQDKVTGSITVQGRDMITDTADDLTVNAAPAVMAAMSALKAESEEVQLLVSALLATINANGVSVPGGSTITKGADTTNVAGGVTLAFNGGMAIPKDSTVTLPDGTVVKGPSTIAPDGTVKSDGGVSMDDVVSVTFYDWNGKALGTRILAKGGSLTGDHNTPDGRGAEKTQAPMPPEGALLYDANENGTYDFVKSNDPGNDVKNKNGYTFAGWVDYENGQTDPNASSGVKAGAAIPVDQLVSLSNIQESITLKAAYNEDAAQIGANVVGRRYMITSTPFVQAGTVLSTTITVRRPQNTRRGAEGDLYLQIGLQATDRGVATVLIPLTGRGDVESVNFTMPLNAADNYDATAALTYTVVDKTSTAMSAGVKIPASAIVVP